MENFAKTQSHCIYCTQAISGLTKERYHISLAYFAFRNIIWFYPIVFFMYVSWHSLKKSNQNLSPSPLNL